MLTELDLMSLEYVCFNMRECDRLEVLGLRPHDNLYQLAWESYHVMRNYGRSRIAWHNGKPAAVCALTESWPGMWEVWAFGTDDFTAAAVPLLRWLRKEIPDILGNTSARRLQADSRADHVTAHKMIKAMGGREEFRLRRYGKDGSDYIRFVWFKEDAACLEPGYVRPADAAE